MNAKQARAAHSYRIKNQHVNKMYCHAYEVMDRFHFRGCFCHMRAGTQTHRVLLTSPAVCLSLLVFP